ncbi:DUF4190 domain-containing protein [Nocardia ignorata]|uniref:DUF4190 domain-containing protein n=1 Tax=Nocardia ignorata TaxID=145285 RepID=A0A4R6PZG1_NOCIG|nr:DUF4190 domain-containing protein [Nocardia ignorata]TDP43026.1 hypothetical protein DFR75_1012146 [Nocardia ignorata]
MSYPLPPQGYYRPPDHPESTLVLVLGVIGVSFCGLTAPFAWLKAKSALAEIDASNGTIGGRSQVYAGYIMGIIGSAMLGIVLLFLVLAVVLMVIGASADTSTY